MQQAKPMHRVLRAAVSVALAGVSLWTVSVAAPAGSVEEAARTLPMALLRFERGVAATESELSPLTLFALRQTPFLLAREPEAAAAAPAPENPTPPDAAAVPPADTPDEPLSVPSDADNGVPARTLRPADPSGYLVRGSVYVNNASGAPLDLDDLAPGFSAVLGDGAPQVLIIHTHGSEAYTMPPGEEYVPSDDHRTTDTNCSVVRVGDEIARVLEEAGIGVVHDRTLYDHPHYSGSYGRSLAAIESYRAQYPSISFVLDVHRDAIEDGQGGQLKLLCAEEPGTAQMEFVLGSDAGGAAHPNWRENLRLAMAVQETLLRDRPTLMRPIIVRSSRYNQHVTTGSLLLEVGTAGNSLSEALAAARLFAAGFAETIRP